MPVSGVQAQKLVEKHPPDLEYPIRDWIQDHENKFTEILQDAEDGELPATTRDLSPAITESLMESKHLHPWALFVLMQRLFGDDWLDWEPETIHATLHREHNIEPHEIIQNQLGALKGVLKDHRFWRDYRVFGWTCTAWNNQVPRFDIIPRPYTAFMLDTVASVRWLRTDVLKPEVKIYITETIKEYGVGAPLALDFVERPASDLAKEYLYARNEESIQDILSEADNDQRHYDLKTIGAIDYYLSRIQALNDQLKRLIGGVALNGTNGSA